MLFLGLKNLLRAWAMLFLGVNNLLHGRARLFLGLEHLLLHARVEVGHLRVESRALSCRKRAQRGGRR